MPRAKRAYEGGYYFIENDLIRSGLYGHTASLDNPVSQQTIDALNIVQATPWRINGWLLDVMKQAYLEGTYIGDLPYADAVDIPRKTDDEWEAMGDIEKTAWKQDLSDIHAVNARMMGRRHSFNHRLDIAAQLREKEAIWFPHFLDFRTRMYPMCQDLHPQTDDAGKALLEFSKGKRLGSRGLYWLAVRLANSYGQDKLPFDERVQWTKDHHDQIVDSGTDPLDGRRFWAGTDEEPWQFLASCKEWAEAHQLDTPEDYVSHLPVNMDGSCNGLQHLSAMGRDRVGAVATNVAANTERQDIYLTVADVVMKLVSADAANGNELAHQWVGKIGRKTVKRAVMTTPYGVTDRGISDQIRKDGHVAGMDEKGKAATYLKDQIVIALEQTVVSAKTIMAWVQKVAQTLSEHDIPFRFTTPTGSVVQQSYFQLAKQRVETLMGQLVLWRQDAMAGLSDRKQMLASAPNLIHAFDAAHLALTVLRMVEESDEEVLLPPRPALRLLPHSRPPSLPKKELRPPRLPLSILQIPLTPHLYFVKMTTSLACPILKRL